METLLSLFLLPSKLMVWLLIIALVLYLFKYRTLSLRFGASAIILYFVFGCGPISQLILGNLEYQYPRYIKSPSADNPPSLIVVLTGSADPKPETPVSSYPNPSSAYRLLEARRVFTLNPDTRIRVSGLNDTPRLLRKGLVSLGVPESMIDIDSEANSTFQSAVNLAEIVNEQPFILITSAGHMPRSMATFKSQGLNPVPAPTEFKTRENIFAAEYLPSPGHMHNSDLAIHEHLAILWYRITGRIQELP